LGGIKISKRVDLAFTRSLLVLSCLDGLNNFPVTGFEGFSALDRRLMSP